ncbi:MAG: hypothetical protein ABW032_00945 [Burkholderiaceae bacterium]
MPADRIDNSSTPPVMFSDSRQRAQTLPMNESSSGRTLPQIFGIERHITAPAWRGTGVDLAPAATPARELLSGLPMMFRTHMNMLKDAAVMLTVRMSGGAHPGSAPVHVLGEPLSLAAQGTPQNARFTGQAPHPDYVVNLWHEIGISDNPDPALRNARPVIAMHVLATRIHQAMSGCFEWLSQPPSDDAYAQVTGRPMESDTQAPARQAIVLMGMVFAKLESGSGEELPRQEGEDRRIRIKVPEAAGRPARLIAELGFGAHGWNFRATDLLYQAELFASFNFANEAPANQPATALTTRAPIAAQQQFEALANVVSLLTKAMSIRDPAHPMAAEFPMLDQSLPLKAPEGDQAAGPDYVVYLSEQFSPGGGAPASPSIAMTISSGSDAQISSGHFKWLKPPSPDAYAVLIGRSPNADAHASARQALGLLGWAFARLRLGSGRAVPPLPGENSRIQLTLPEAPGGLKRFIFDLGYFQDGGLRLQVRDTAPGGGLLDASFEPSFSNLLSASLQPMEDLQPSI